MNGLDGLNGLDGAGTDWGMRSPRSLISEDKFGEGVEVCQSEFLSM